MTSKERLMTALARRQPDRVPVSPNMVLWAADVYGDYAWQRQLALAEEFDMDAIIDVRFHMPECLTHAKPDRCGVPENVSVEVEVRTEDELDVFKRTFDTPSGKLTDEIAIGHGRSKYGLAPSPVWREPLVKSSEDVERIPYLLPDPKKAPAPDWHEIEREAGNRGVLRVHPMPGVSPSVMPLLMGVEKAMIAFYEDRVLFDRLLDLLADHFQEVTKQMLEFGARYLFVSWHNLGVSAGWSPAIWREAFKPVIKANVDLVHRYGAFYHYFDNGPIMPLLPEIAEIGVDSISSLCPPPVADVSLAEAKRLIGDKVCLIGNVDAIYTVQKGTPEDVRNAVRETIEAAGQGGAFILGNSDTFFPGTPRENIEAFFKAGREFGRYPIQIT